ncbi:MAG: hypothetical protein JW860_02740 [Sedimentisphaerales bacterium]|nr:hypothetical protein [Sedimentisphaerales bacterium]
MIPDDHLIEKGLLIVTGSTLRSEQADRPLAYCLKEKIEEAIEGQDNDFTILVISDLWYLNGEALQRLPTISIGGPGVNALSAHLYKRLTNALVIDNTLLIQMDPQLNDLRVSIWGMDHQTTVEALEIFINKGYLTRFLEAVTARLS